MYKRQRKYNAIAGIKSTKQLSEIMQFFISRKGRLHSFRFSDPFDNTSCSIERTPSNLDQPLGFGDGETTEFQLVKLYGEQIRPITKPLEDSVLLAANGQAIEASEFRVSALTGIVIFAAPPTSGTVLTAGFSFDTVVRFDTDFLDMILEDFGAGQLQNLPMVELPYA